MATDGIPQNIYLGEYFKLQLPQIDRLVEFTLKKGRNCLVSKEDLCRAYCQFPIHPKDYHLLGCHYQGKFYFVTRPFSLHLWALIFQCTTKAVVHIFPKQGFLADVYLDDSYGAEYPFLAASAFSQLSQLLHQLGSDSAPDRDSPPSTSMICPTVTFPLEVPIDKSYGFTSHINDLSSCFVFHKETASVSSWEALLPYCVC